MLIKLKNFIMAFVCVMVIVCMAISITVLFKPLYYLAIEQLDIAETSGYTTTQCRENYDALINYNMLISPDTLEFPDFPMSEHGRIHFEEVKDIFVTAQWVALAGLAMFFGRIFWQRRRGNKDFYWMRMTGWVGLGIVAIVGGAVIIDWDMAFTLMHEMLFDNDYWIFSSVTDPVIKILPDSFFLLCGVVILALVVLSIVGLWVLSKKLERIFKNIEPDMEENEVS